MNNNYNDDNTNPSSRDIKKNDDIYNNNNINKIENEKFKKYTYVFFISFLFIGLINNLGYVLILTGSQQLTSNFNNDNIIALYPLALIGFSSFARFINSKFCIKISYTKRLLGLSLYFFLGYISLFIILNSMSENDEDISIAKFFLTLIPTIIMGTGSSFGEATMLGYIKNFPSSYVSGWGSGTGCAGVTGATISLLSKKNNWKLKYLYLYISPVSLVYFLFYLLTLLLKEKSEKNSKNEKYRAMIEEKPIEEKKESTEEKKIIDDKELNNYDTFPKEKGSITPIINQSIPDEMTKTDISQNKEFTFENFKKGFKYGKRFILNLGLVYYLEYVIISGLAERVSIEKEYLKKSFFHEYLYETFLLAYQIGVVISRSSLPIVKNIPYVEAFTLCQLMNVILWIVEYYLIYITSEYILFFHLIFIGLNGGSSYVGCFYYIMNSKHILPEYKELCINIGTIFNDIGILSSSITCLILDNTIMH